MNNHLCFSVFIVWLMLTGVLVGFVGVSLVCFFFAPLLRSIFRVNCTKMVDARNALPLPYFCQNAGSRVPKEKVLQELQPEVTPIRPACGSRN